MPIMLRGYDVVRRIMFRLKSHDRLPSMQRNECSEMLEMPKSINNGALSQPLKANMHKGNDPVRYRW